jgi:hypothetical protein
MKTFLKTDLPKRAIFAVLVLALIAGVVAGREKPATQVSERTSARTEAPHVVDDIDLTRLERPAAQPPQADPFARRSFAPPARQQASAGPAKPVAPPLPFRYMGKLTQNGKTEVFVLRGEDIISIAPGQRIDAEYRVERITDDAIRLTYLPLKARQTLELAQ